MNTEVYNKAIVCRNCFDFVGWSKDALEDCICNKCRIKLAEQKAYRQAFKETVKSQ